MAAPKRKALDKILEMCFTRDEFPDPDLLHEASMELDAFTKKDKPNNKET